ncbi:MAG: DedA family protein [Zoogloea sp.]|nr:DedA family protein [Zoogloea sp.]
MDLLLHPGADTTLAGLAVASFLSATVLPGGSEAALAGAIALHPGHLPAALLLASIGNTLGGMVTWAMGHGMARKHALPARLAWVERYGSPLLLFAWVPLVGDALCLGAGYLRLSWLPCLLWMGTGKLARYAVVAMLMMH